MTASVLWLRRDLRLADAPALLAARDAADEVVPLFVLDDVLRGTSGAPRLAFLYGCLRELTERTDGRLRVLTGRPEEVVPRVVRETGRGERARQQRPRAVRPGARRAGGGRARGPADGDRVAVRRDAGPAAQGRRHPVQGLQPVRPRLGRPRRAVAGDHPAGRALERRRAADRRRARRPRPRRRAAPAGRRAGRAGALEAVPRRERRELPRPAHSPGVDGTSQLSVYLKYGCIHPRTLLDALPPGEGGDAIRREVVFRDFYADVLHWHPESARRELQPQMAALEYDEGRVADARFQAWAQGRTGYPIVDAGMRQLLEQRGCTTGCG